MTLPDARRAILTPLLVTAFAVAVTGAPEAEAFERRTMGCELEDLTRTISLRIDPDAGYVCDVLYEKPDEGATREVVWSARNDADYCTPRFDSLVEGLVSRGWTCDTVEEPVDADDQPAMGAAMDGRSDDDEAGSEGLRGQFRDRCVADVTSGDDAEGAGSVKTYCGCVADGMESQGMSEEEARVIFDGLASVSAESEDTSSGGDKGLNTLFANYESVVESCR